MKTYAPVQNLQSSFLVGMLVRLTPMTGMVVFVRAMFSRMLMIMFVPRPGVHMFVRMLMFVLMGMTMRVFMRVLLAIVRVFVAM
jgi:hypothetical protein